MTSPWSVLPFTRGCFEFLTTLTLRALRRNHIATVALLPFTRACLEFHTTLTCRALDGKSQCHSCSLPFVRAPSRTPQENRVVAVTFETIKKNASFLYFWYSRDTIRQFKNYSRMDDNRGISKTAAKLHKFPSGTLGRID